MNNLAVSRDIFYGFKNNKAALCHVSPGPFLKIESAVKKLYIFITVDIL